MGFNVDFFNLFKSIKQKGRSDYLGLPVVEQSSSSPELVTKSVLDMNSRKVLKAHIFTLNLVDLRRLPVNILGVN